MRLYRRRLLLLLDAASIFVVVASTVTTKTIPASSFPLVVTSSASSQRGQRGERSRCFGRSRAGGSPFWASSAETTATNHPTDGSEAAQSPLAMSSLLTTEEDEEAGGSTGIIRVTATHRPSDLQKREPVCEYHEISVSPTTTPSTASNPIEVLPQQVISTRDVTPTLKQLIRQSGIQYGTLTVLSRHTTTSIVINEHECRLAQDVTNHLLTLAPIDERSSHPLRQKGTRYLHNDIDQRPDSPEEFQRCLENGYDVRNPEVLQQWRDQEPINAHSHLLSMLLGSSESIPIVNGTMAIGQWQSVLLVDLDGPRTRTVGVNLMGYR